MNDESFENIIGNEFQDASDVNPGRRIFSREYKGCVHKGLNEIVGKLKFIFKAGSRPKRALKMVVSLYADKMIARTEDFSIHLTAEGVILKKTSSKPLY